MLELSWGDDELEADNDPCIRERIGDKVCEISGLSDLLQELRDLEAEEKLKEENLIKLGDQMVDGRDPIDNMNDASLAQDAIEYANA